jgi:hypothetical protein
MRSRRLADIGNFYGKLLAQGIAQGHFSALLPVGQNHLVQGVPEQSPAVFQILALPAHGSRLPVHCCRRTYDFPPLVPDGSLFFRKGLAFRFGFGIIYWLSIEAGGRGFPGH